MSDLKSYREENKDNMIIGFCLQLKFIQDSISSDLDSFISFIKDNQNFFNNPYIHSYVYGIESIKDILVYFTDLIYFDVDKDNKHTLYHKDYY